ncbi:MAG TPA: DUF1707 domain-containing protein [Solirubrobacteraceae bacterium]|jgi:hypothetical protein
MPASYFTLERATPVTDRFGQPVGEVKKVLIAYGDYFDGVIVRTRVGDRFVDAPEVRRIEKDEVELSIALCDVEYPGPKGPPGPPDVHGVRRDRLEATDDDRTVAVTQLKIAFVEDRLGVADLERRVELVHRATQLRELDDALTDLV